MNPEQASLLDDLIDTDIAAIEAELQALQTVLAPTREKAKVQTHCFAGRVSRGDKPGRRVAFDIREPFAYGQQTRRVPHSLI